MPKHIFQALVALLAIAGIQQRIYADVISSWDFSNTFINYNSLPSIDAQLKPALGTTQLTMVINSFDQSLSLFGLTQTARAGNFALRVQPTAGNLIVSNDPASNNGSTLTFQTRTLGFTGVSFSFLARSYIGADPSAQPTPFRFTLARSIDGVTFSDLSGAISVLPQSLSPGDGAFVAYNFSVPSLDNLGSAFVRLTLSGAQQGANPFDLDNVQFTGTNISTVPEPSSAVMLLLGSSIYFVVKRRRARK